MACSPDTASRSLAEAAPSSDAPKHVTVRASDVQEELVCRICLCIMDDAHAVSHCLHRFCRGCITKWCVMLTPPIPSACHALTTPYPCVVVRIRQCKMCCPTCRVRIRTRRDLKRDRGMNALIDVLCPDAEQLEDDEQRRLEKANKACFNSAFAQSCNSGILKQGMAAATLPRPRARTATQSAPATATARETPPMLEENSQQLARASPEMMQLAEARQDWTPPKLSGPRRAKVSRRAPSGAASARAPKRARCSAGAGAGAGASVGAGASAEAGTGDSAELSAEAEVAELVLRRHPLESQLERTAAELVSCPLLLTMCQLKRYLATVLSGRGFAPAWWPQLQLLCAIGPRVVELDNALTYQELCMFAANEMRELEHAVDSAQRITPVVPVVHYRIAQT
eukprot:g3960.t1